MTDEELIKSLRNFDDGGVTPTREAADRIEQLKEKLKSQIAHTDALVRGAEPMMALALGAAENAAELAEAKLSKAVDALRLVTDACDEGKMVSLGAGGMTIDAQIRRCVYNQVPAWPIEEARAVLAELEKSE
jgi:hypothetical protein